MVHSRYGPFWEWTVLGMVILRMVVLGLVLVLSKLFSINLPKIIRPTVFTVFTKH